MAEPDRLLVVWSSADREVALYNVFMYTHNAKKNGWFDTVRLLIWGPSGRLLTVDEEVQGALRAMQEDGVDVIACKACADRLGVTDGLEALGVNVFYVGSTLTEMLKGGWATLTY
jgi:hypothetical protein